MRKELSQLHRRLQATIIYVTHDQIEAMTLGTRICVMSNGYIQQVGTPLEVYDMPKNVFVAKFIGTPAMNILEGSFEGGKNFIESGASLDLSGVISKDLSGEGFLGVRPEDVRLSEGENNANPKLKATVDIIERLGDEQLVYAKTAAGNSFICKLDSHIEIDYGQEATFEFDVKKVHAFDASEENVTDFTHRG
jgi:multiple sugar transport system ATP-binding protein